MGLTFLQNIQQSTAVHAKKTVQLLQQETQHPECACVVKSHHFKQKKQLFTCNNTAQNLEVHNEMTIPKQLILSILKTLNLRPYI